MLSNITQDPYKYAYVDSDLLKVDSPLSREERIRLANKLCFYLEHGTLSQETDLLLDVLRKLSSDTDDDVRQAIATSLCHSDRIPHEIAIKLAYDIHTISSKMLKNSKQLTEEDLINIIHDTKDSKKLSSIAKRSNITHKVAEEIIAVDEKNSTLELLNNPNSKISLNAYKKILSRHQHNAEYMKAIYARNDLTKKDVYKLLGIVDESIKETLIKAYEISEHKPTDFCKTDILGPIDPAASRTKEERRIRLNVDLLYSKNLLNSTVILRYLCKGNVFAFLYSISKISDIPYQSVKEIILQKHDTLAFEKLYQDSGLLSSAMEAVKILIKIIASESDKGGLTPENFANRITSRVTSLGYDDTPDMNYLLRLVKK